MSTGGISWLINLLQPEGSKSASRMENLSGRSVTKKGNSIRKAFLRAYGWNFFPLQSVCHRVFSTERPKISLADGKSIRAYLGADGFFQPEGQKTASRMENLFRTKNSPSRRKGCHVFSFLPRLLLRTHRPKLTPLRSAVSS